MAGEDHRFDLRNGADLRKRQHQTVRQPAVGNESADKQVQCPESAAARGRFEALEPDADERRGDAVAHRLGHQLGGPDGVCVFLVVGPVSVPVLEVQTQILNRLGRQLRQRLAGNPGRQVGVEPEGAAQSVHSPGPFDDGHRLGAPGTRQRRLVFVGRHIHGVHGLPGAVVARVGTFQQFIGLRQRLIEGGVVFRTEGCHGRGAETCGCGHGQLTSS